eukprot:6174192-Pleurochrysis_carterae.AAC.1
MDKVRAVEQGIHNGRLGDSATAAGAELFAIFAIIRKVQAKQDMGHYGKSQDLNHETTKWSGTRSYHECKGKPGNGDLHVVPVTCWIIPNVTADNVAAQEQEATPEGMVTGLISKQVKSRPMIYSRKVMGHIVVELADNPIYQKVRRRGKKLIRETHKPPEGRDKCESGVARGLVDGCNTEEEEDSDTEMDIERQGGKREV